MNGICRRLEMHIKQYESKKLCHYFVTIEYWLMHLGRYCIFFILLLLLEQHIEHMLKSGQVNLCGALLINTHSAVILHNAIAIILLRPSLVHINTFTINTSIWSNKQYESMQKLCITWVDIWLSYNVLHFMKIEPI